jgi:hypothetical protein
MLGSYEPCPTDFARVHGRREFRRTYSMVVALDRKCDLVLNSLQILHGALQIYIILGQRCMDDSPTQVRTSSILARTEWIYVS